MIIGESGDKGMITRKSNDIDRYDNKSIVDKKKPNEKILFMKSNLNLSSNLNLCLKFKYYPTDKFYWVYIKKKRKRNHCEMIASANMHDLFFRFQKKKKLLSNNLFHWNQLGSLASFQF